MGGSHQQKHAWIVVRCGKLVHCSRCCKACQKSVELSYYIKVLLKHLKDHNLMEESPSNPDRNQ